MTTWLRRRSGEHRQRLAKPFCDCFADREKCSKMDILIGCKCGEHVNVSEWAWEIPRNMDSGLVVMSNDNKQVTFHPFYSAGTAMVRGNVPFLHDYHYYWEVKMLSDPYGTDIMVGLGTEKVDGSVTRYRFTSLLGQDAESYGLSYTGAIRHDDKVSRDGTGFCKGSIIGVKVDLWQGTLEFSLNREPKGISFFNLRRHPTETLFPMICATAAQTSLRLIYASSWKASLLVDAAKILGASVIGDLYLPPGLRNQMRSQFWLTMPNNSCSKDEKLSTASGPAPTEEKPEEKPEEPTNYVIPNDYPFVPNEYYTDSVSADYRVAVIYDGIDNDR